MLEKFSINISLIYVIFIVQADDDEDDEDYNTMPNLCGIPFYDSDDKNEDEAPGNNANPVESDHLDEHGDNVDENFDDVSYLLFNII